MQHFVRRELSALALCIAIAMPMKEAAADSAPVVFSAAGADVAAIAPTVNEFRNALGTLNANIAGSFGSGRREINWDGVPDAFAAPNALPGNFFNVNSPRGVVLVTPGSGFQVSASSASATPIEFGNINPAYSLNFAPFSPQRLFTAVGSNITDVNFFVPGSSNAALTRGFGVVFSDVDVANSTLLTFFGLNNQVLATLSAPATTGNETFSFLGALFDSPLVSRVRITSGNAILSASSNDPDVVVMDDFIYGEPVASVPLPATLPLFATGLGALAMFGWRRRKKAASLAE